MRLNKFAFSHSHFWSESQVSSCKVRLLRSTGIEFTLPRLASYDLFGYGESIDPVLGVKKYPAMVYHRPLSLAAHNEVNLYVLVDRIHVLGLS